jgi:hypothetical protein
LTGGLGEIPEPTVKVRIRENQQKVFRSSLRLTSFCYSTPKFHIRFGPNLGGEDAKVHE